MVLKVVIIHKQMFQLCKIPIQFNYPVLKDKKVFQLRGFEKM